MSLFFLSILRLGNIYYWFFPAEPDCWELPQYTDQGLLMALPSVVNTVHNMHSKIFFFVVGYRICLNTYEHRLMTNQKWRISWSWVQTE